MKRENSIPHIGLTLDSPRVAASEASLPMQFIYYYVVLLLGLTGTFGCFYTAFSIPLSWNVLILCGVLFSAAFTVLFLRRRYRVFTVAIGALLLSFLFFLKSGFVKTLGECVVQGFARTVNVVLVTFDDSSTYAFYTLPVKSASSRQITLSHTVFAVLLLLLLSFALSWLLICLKNRLLCILFTAPLAGVSLIFAIIPHYAAVAVLLMFWAFLLLNEPPFHWRRSSISKKSASHGCTRVNAEGHSSANPASLVILPVLAAGLLLVAILFPMKSFQRSRFVEDLRSGLTSSRSISSNFQTGGVAANSSEVNLQRAGNLSFSGKTVLRVESPKKEGGYLKGYVGSVYTGQSWEDLSEEDYQELDTILDDWKVQCFPYQFARLLHTASDRIMAEYSMTVQNVGANPRCIYAPYGLASGPEDVSGIDFVNDGFLRSDNALFGTEEYTLKVASLANSTMYLPLINRLMNSIGPTGGDDSLSFESIQQAETYVIPDTVLAELTPEQASLALSAQAYAQFVYEHYTQLPEGLKDKLDQYREERGLDTEHFWWPYELAQAIINQVQSENVYTLTPGTTPTGEDFVEYFLFENHRGYCMHFASAAVVLLRSAGIPARYAEGYAVAASDFQEDGWADIPDSRAHAWVEIYVSGVGWVPVEATPGAINGVINYETVSSPSPSPTEPSEEATPSKPVITPTDTPAPTQIGDTTSSQPDKSGEAAGTQGASEEILHTVLRLLALLAAVGLLPVAFRINRRLHIASRRKAFLQADNKKAALAMYEYIQKLQPYIKAAPDASSELPEEYQELVLKARFSQHTLTDLEIRKLLNYTKSLASEAREKTTPVRRFWGKYVRSVF